jgi:hypothetical protein
MGGRRVPKDAVSIRGRNMMLRNKICSVFVVLVVLAILGLIGEMDEKDAITERDLYCQMVAQEKWPDYRHTAKSDCPIIDAVSAATQ